jgi:hypothetical protein
LKLIDVLTAPHDLKRPCVSCSLRVCIFRRQSVLALSSC